MTTFGRTMTADFVERFLPEMRAIVHEIALAHRVQD